MKIDLTIASGYEIRGKISHRTIRIDETLNLPVSFWPPVPYTTVNTSQYTSSRWDGPPGPNPNGNQDNSLDGYNVFVKAHWLTNPTIRELCPPGLRGPADPGVWEAIWSINSLPQMNMPYSHFRGYYLTGPDDIPYLNSWENFLRNAYSNGTRTNDTSTTFTDYTDPLRDTFGIYNIPAYTTTDVYPPILCAGQEIQQTPDSLDSMSIGPINSLSIGGELWVPTSLEANCTWIHLGQNLPRTATTNPPISFNNNWPSVPITLGQCNNCDLSATQLLVPPTRTINSSLSCDKSIIIDSDCIIYNTNISCGTLCGAQSDDDRGSVLAECDIETSIFQSYNLQCRLINCNLSTNQHARFYLSRIDNTNIECTYDSGIIVNSLWSVNSVPLFVRVSGWDEINQRIWDGDIMRFIEPLAFNFGTSYPQDYDFSCDNSTFNNCRIKSNSGIIGSDGVRFKNNTKATFDYLRYFGNINIDNSHIVARIDRCKGFTNSSLINLTNSGIMDLEVYYECDNGRNLNEVNFNIDATSILNLSAISGIQAWDSYNGGTVNVNTSISMRNNYGTITGPSCAVENNYWSIETTYSRIKDNFGYLLGENVDIYGDNDPFGSTALCSFYGSAENHSTMAIDAIFYGKSRNNGVCKNPTFYGQSINAGTAEDSASFYEKSTNTTHNPKCKTYIFANYSISESTAIIKNANISISDYAWVGSAESCQISMVDGGLVFSNSCNITATNKASITMAMHNNNIILENSSVYGGDLGGIYDEFARGNTIILNNNSLLHGNFLNYSWPQFPGGECHQPQNPKKPSLCNKKNNCRNCCEINDPCFVSCYNTPVDPFSGGGIIVNDNSLVISANINTTIGPKIPCSSFSIGQGSPEGDYLIPIIFNDNARSLDSHIKYGIFNDKSSMQGGKATLCTFKDNSNCYSTVAEFCTFDDNSTAVVMGNSICIMRGNSSVTVGENGSTIVLESNNSIVGIAHSAVIVDITGSNGQIGGKWNNQSYFRISKYAKFDTLTIPSEHLDGRTPTKLLVLGTIEHLIVDNILVLELMGGVINKMTIGPKGQVWIVGGYLGRIVNLSNNGALLIDTDQISIHSTINTKYIEIKQAANICTPNGPGLVVCQPGALGPNYDPFCLSCGTRSPNYHTSSYAGVACATVTQSVAAVEHYVFLNVELFIGHEIKIPLTPLIPGPMIAWPSRFITYSIPYPPYRLTTTDSLQFPYPEYQPPSNRCNSK